MITEAVKEETKSVLAAIDESRMDPDRKSRLRRMLVRAEEGTNGLTPEQKLQTVSESVFDQVTPVAFTFSAKVPELTTNEPARMVTFTR